MNTLKFGEILRELREKSGMSQNDLAVKMRVSKSSISMYEINSRLPSIEALASAAEVFHVSTDYLLGIDKKKRMDLSGLTDDDIEILERMRDSMIIKNEKIRRW